MSDEKKVVHLSEVVKSRLPQADVIKVLEDLLGLAKSGEVQALAFVTVEKDEGVGTGWCGGTYRSLLGFGVSHLAHRYHQAVREDD